MRAMGRAGHGLRRRWGRSVFHRGKPSLGSGGAQTSCLRASPPDTPTATQAAPGPAHRRRRNDARWKSHARRREHPVFRASAPDTPAPTQGTPVPARRRRRKDARWKSRAQRRSG